MSAGKNFRWLLLVIYAGAAIIGGGSSAVAAETHAFDPALSLTGNCKVSVLDPIADPGLCPGVAGVDHPTAAFNNVGGVATDSYGNIYVTNTAPEHSGEGRIDVFDSSGFFITEIKDSEGPQAIAVDSEGHLYVSHVGWEDPEYGVVRYDPILPYEPAKGKIEYGASSTGVVENTESFHGLALDPATDRLFVKLSGHVEEYKSAAEGNGLIEDFGLGQIGGGEDAGIALDSARGRLYVGVTEKPGCLCIYALKLAPPHELLFKIEGSAVPRGKFTSTVLSLAVDEGNGHLFAYDGAVNKVFEFDESGAYLSTIEHGFEYNFGSEIGIDNGENSPHGALNPKGRYLFVPSSSGAKGGGTGHSYAFGPPTICPPAVESISFDHVGEGEAELQAEIEPCSLPTHYVFEFLAQQQFEEQGGSFAGAQVAGEGDLPAEAAPVSVAAAATGLSSGTAYRFRVIATNELGSDEDQDGFATYLGAEGGPICPNATLRTGLSALLSDCRAYELVTPPATNAHTPVGAGIFVGTFFSSPQASPTGDEVSFKLEGGSIPGTEAIGSLAGDPYVARRGVDGWGTAYTGPSGFEATSLLPGSNSPDQGYSFWTAQGEGSAVVEGNSTNYVRYPDGHSGLVGRGSLNTDPQAEGKLISENGDHIIFVSRTFEHEGVLHPAVQLEPDAPSDGTSTVYDRTADEVTHVVSLLPGNETPAAGQDATYAGASVDGKGVAFKIANKLYLRYNNEETYELGEGTTFAGIAGGGNRAFYLKGGQLWRFDAITEEATEFSSGPVTPVNVSADGSTAYFVSQGVLTSEPNPNGAGAQGGQENLYRSEEGAISFVGTITKRDVEGEELINGRTDGLGLWTKKVGEGALGADPSRVTPDGNGMLFESRADLAGYDSGGHAEIYRYDSAADELDCLSCNPTLAPASGDASLQSISPEPGSPEPLSTYSYLANLRADGRRAFFQSEEALVPADIDHLQDVYEWEAQGVGSCNRAGGCVYLISSGQSQRADYLYGISESGDDVFFSTKDLLLPSDLEETASVYDARVDGGFAEDCSGEACQPLLPPTPPNQAPSIPGLATQAVGESGNVDGKTCGKGKRRIRRHGKVRCVKKKHHKHHHRKAGNKKKGAGK